MSKESLEQIIANKTGKAVRDFAAIEIDRLARRIVHALQRMPASGIYGDDYAYKSLWDEYCHEAQEGPHDGLEGSWEMTINPFVDEVLDKIPHHVGVLLTILAASNLDEPQEAEMIGAFDREGIKELVLSSIDEIARRREISRFRAF